MTTTTAEITTTSVGDTEAPVQDPVEQELKEYVKLIRSLLTRNEPQVSPDEVHDLIVKAFNDSDIPCTNIEQFIIQSVNQLLDTAESPEEYAQIYRYLGWRTQSLLKEMNDSDKEGIKNIMHASSLEDVAWATIVKLEEQEPQAIINPSIFVCLYGLIRHPDPDVRKKALEMCETLVNTLHPKDGGDDRFIKTVNNPDAQLPPEAITLFAMLGRLDIIEEFARHREKDKVIKSLYAAAYGYGLSNEQDNYDGMFNLLLIVLREWNDETVILAARNAFQQGQKAQSNMPKA